MADPCSSTHEGVSCTLMGNHRMHSGRTDDGFVQWPNDAYIAPEPKRKWQPKPKAVMSKTELREAQVAANADASQESARWAKLLGPHAFENGDEASHSAAELIRDSSVSLRVQVLRLIVETPAGITDEQIERRLKMKHQTASARRRELVLAGLVESLGKTRNDSGAWANIWHATDDGARALAQVTPRHQEGGAS